ncbi:MAG: hypothetical protein Ct9H300mP21_00430 [Pseudomonadota bacterium]|nr:MAG: hypothetical protein Ct9H300mP21_00430 [Pseudomonadota bacterium]
MLGHGGQPWRGCLPTVATPFKSGAANLKLQKISSRNTSTPLFYRIFYFRNYLEPALICLKSSREIFPYSRAAPPSHLTREIAKKIRPEITAKHILLILSKGIEQHSLALMSEIFRKNSTTAEISSSFRPDVCRKLLWISICRVRAL